MNEEFNGNLKVKINIKIEKFKCALGACKCIATSYIIYKHPTPKNPIFTTIHFNYCPFCFKIALNTIPSIQQSRELLHLIEGKLYSIKEKMNDTNCGRSKIKRH